MKKPQRASQDHQPAPPLADMAKIEWSYWQAVLAGEPPPRTHPAFVPWGYYRWTDRRPRTAKDIPVAIYPDAKGNKWVVIGDAKAFKFRDAADEEDFGMSKFAYFDKAAISYEAYQHWQANKAWPADAAADAIAKSEAPREGNGEPHEILEETLADLQEECKAWYESLGEAGITTQENADKAGNFADRFAEIEREADEARTTGRKPHLDAAAAVQKIWHPIQNTADVAKKWAKGLTVKWLAAENARKLQEAAAAAAKGEAVSMATLKGARAGTRGRAVTARVEKKFVCEDYKKVREYFLKDPAFIESNELAAILGRWAKERLLAGTDVPGAKLETVNSAS